MNYEPIYTSRFNRHYQAFHSMRVRIEKVVAQIIDDPYSRSERLKFKGGFNLKGCRSARVGRNFRIIFVVCEECRKEPECEYCYCENLPDQTVIFLTVGPHEKAYKMK